MPQSRHSLAFREKGKFHQAKSADPQLMKENEVTHPRESRIAGQKKTDGE